MSTVSRTIQAIRTAATPIKNRLVGPSKAELVRQASMMPTDKLLGLCQSPSKGKKQDAALRVAQARLSSLHELAAWRINAMRHYNQQARELLGASDMAGARKALQKSRVALKYARIVAADMSLLAKVVEPQV